MARRAVQRLEAKGKGILLLHDIHQRTVEALPIILEELKARGFRIVHVVPASAERPATVTAADAWLPNSRPRSSPLPVILIADVQEPRAPTCCRKRPPTELCSLHAAATPRRRVGRRAAGTAAHGADRACERRRTDKRHAKAGQHEPATQARRKVAHASAWRQRDIASSHHAVQSPPSSSGSGFALAADLVDAHRDIERLAAAAIAAAAHRRRAEIIEADRDAHMGVGRADAVGGVEGDPAEIGHESLGPGVAGLLLGHAVGAMEMAADIARRNGEAARGGDEDMGQVLAHAALERERLGRRGGRLVSARCRISSRRAAVRAGRAGSPADRRRRAAKAWRTPRSRGRAASAASRADKGSAETARSRRPPRRWCPGCRPRPRPAREAPRAAPRR